MVRVQRLRVFPVAIRSVVEIRVHAEPRSKAQAGMGAKRPSGRTRMPRILPLLLWAGKGEGSDRRVRQPHGCCNQPRWQA